MKPFRRRRAKGAARKRSPERARRGRPARTGRIDPPSQPSDARGKREKAKPKRRREPRLRRRGSSKPPARTARRRAGRADLRRLRAALARELRAGWRAIARGWRATRARAKRAQPALARLRRLLARLLKPLLALLLGTVVRLDRLLRLLLALAAGSARRLARAATAASRVLTPARAIALAAVACGAALAVSQFVDYHAVEIGQPGYAGLAAGTPAPTIAPQAAGAAHAYLLLPVAFGAIALAVLAAWKGRPSLGRAIAILGLAGVAVSLLVDLPKGLDAGGQEAIFAGAKATLLDGFYGQLAASGGLIVAGLLLALSAKPAPRWARQRRRAPRSRRSRRRGRLAEGPT